MQKSASVKMWLRQSVAEKMHHEASARYPVESGGILMGYWVDQRTVVVTYCIGPGANARHSREGFSPDHEWQRAEVARHYETSGRMETYLGDWHCHPDADSAGLSRKDRATLYRIAADPAARAPTALMVVLFGEPDTWRLAGWVGRAGRKLLVPRLSLTPVVPQIEH